MKKLIMMMAIMISFVGINVGQTKVDNSVRFKTELKTFNVDFYDGYYTSIFTSGYQYPAITEGFYTTGFFLSYSDLIRLYECLLEISKLEDGEYTLQIKLNNIECVKKTGTKIKFKVLTYYNYNPQYIYCIWNIV